MGAVDVCPLALGGEEVGAAGDLRNGVDNGLGICEDVAHPGLEVVEGDVVGEVLRPQAFEGVV